MIAYRAETALVKLFAADAPGFILHPRGLQGQRGFLQPHGAIGVAEVIIGRRLEIAVRAELDQPIGGALFAAREDHRFLALLDDPVGHLDHFGRDAAQPGQVAGQTVMLPDRTEERPRVGRPEIHGEEAVRLLKGQERVEDLPRRVRPAPKIQGVGQEGGAVSEDLLVESGPVVRFEDAVDLVHVERGVGQPGPGRLVDPGFGHVELEPGVQLLDPEGEHRFDGRVEFGFGDLPVFLGLDGEGDAEMDFLGSARGQLQFPRFGSIGRHLRGEAQADSRLDRLRARVFRFQLNKGA